MVVDFSSECALSDLQDDFLKYPQSEMSGSSMAEGYKERDDDCMQWCRSVTGCRSIDYNFDTLDCFLYNVTVLDVPASDWFVGLYTVSHYQKMCA